MSPTDQVMKYIVGLATAAALSLSGWSLLSTVGHESRISVEESKSVAVDKHMDRLEDKIDELLRRTPPTPEWRSGRNTDGIDTPTYRRRPLSDARSSDSRP